MDFVVAVSNNWMAFTVFNLIYYAIQSLKKQKNINEKQLKYYEVACAHYDPFLYIDFSINFEGF